MTGPGYEKAFKAVFKAAPAPCSGCHSWCCQKQPERQRTPLGRGSSQLKQLSNTINISMAEGGGGAVSAMGPG